MAVVSKIVHCYQLNSESGLQAVTLPCTGHSYLLATKLAYKTRALDDKCIMHLCMQLKYFSYLAILSLARIPCVPSGNIMHMIKPQSVLI